MRLITLAALALVLTAADASAGPIRDRLAARRGCGQQARPAAFRPAPAPAAVPVVRPAVSSCPGGVCPVPTRR